MPKNGCEIKISIIDTYPNRYGNSAIIAKKNNGASILMSCSVLSEFK